MLMTRISNGPFDRSSSAPFVRLKYYRPLDTGDGNHQSQRSKSLPFSVRRRAAFAQREDGPLLRMTDS